MPGWGTRMLHRHLTIAVGATTASDLFSLHAWAGPHTLVYYSAHPDFFGRVAYQAHQAHAFCTLPVRPVLLHAVVLPTLALCLRWPGMC